MKRVFAAAALVVAACAPPSPALRPLPPETTKPLIAHESGSFEGAHGTRLFEQSWHPSGKTRAVIVIHHGLKSHSEHYADFARRAASIGYAVYAYDMRGHGRSEGPRATLDDFEDLTSDLATFMGRVKMREPAAPVFLMGHSVGGAVVTLYTEERKPKLAGLIVLAAAIRVDSPPIVAAAAPLSALLTPNFPALDVPNSAFSRDSAVVADMDKDPLIYQPPGPARSIGGLVAAIEKIWAHADEIDVPILGLHGTADKATDPRGTIDLVNGVHSSDKKLLLYKGLYHDMFHEPEHEQVLGDVFAWLKART